MIAMLLNTNIAMGIHIHTSSLSLSQTLMSVKMIQMFAAQTQTALIIRAATAANATRVTATMATTSQNASVSVRFGSVFMV